MLPRRIPRRLRLLAIPWAGLAVLVIIAISLALHEFTRVDWEVRGRVATAIGVISLLSIFPAIAMVATAWSSRYTDSSRRGCLHCGYPWPPQERPDPEQRCPECGSPAESMMRAPQRWLVAMTLGHLVELAFLLGAGFGFLWLGRVLPMMSV